MSIFYRCDNDYCKSEVDDEDYVKQNWIHNSDYDFDACSDKCNQELCHRYYSEE